MIRFLLLSLLVLAGLGCAFPPRAASGQEAQEGMPEGRWIAVARGTVDAEGGLMRLAAQREGLIVEVMAEEGDHVKADQPLARIDDNTARLQVEISEGELGQAQVQRDLTNLRRDQADAEVARLRPLSAADAIPRRQLDEAENTARLAALEAKNAESAVALAEKRLQSQQLEIDARTVRAPVDGVILRRSARRGDGTTTQTVTEMFLLAPDGGRVLRAQLDEQFVGLVHAGQKAEVIRERDDGSVITATVARVAPVFGTAQSAGAGQAGRSDDARTVEITLTLDGPPDQIARLVLGQRMIARILK